MRKLLSFSLALRSSRFESSSFFFLLAAVVPAVLLPTGFGEAEDVAASGSSVFGFSPSRSVLYPPLSSGFRFKPLLAASEVREKIKEKWIPGEKMCLY